MVRLLGCCLLLGLAGSAAAAGPAEVVVLSTLHKLHAEVPAYDNAAFGAAIVALKPDVLCIEVGPEAYAARKPERTKVEYPQVVYPLIDTHRYPVCLLEPADAKAREIGLPYMKAQAQFQERQPEKAAAQGRYMEALFDALKQHWTSPAAVNDPVTDTLLQGKHALQEALQGEEERAGWDAWNQHFLARIVEAAAEHAGKRVVVLVGAEHGYWLRQRLADHQDVCLADTVALLNGKSGGCL